MPESLAAGRRARIIIAAGIYLAAAACVSAPETGRPARELPSFPPVRFAVLSDPHLHTPSLGMTGKEFWDNVNQGKKLLHLSEEILSTVIDEIAADPGVGFVIIPGDLTKDGERENHLRAAALLSRLSAAGKKVYVTPGNHDIMNFHARRYGKDGASPAPSVSAKEFAEIYAAFGFSSALARDPHSLSYVAEPVDGLWLFALDSCVYESNSPQHPSETSGRFNNETLAWILEMLDSARERGKAVMGFMHHGLLEHFKSQRKYFSAFVVDDSDKVARLLASGGLRFMFTGHFHAQDVTERRFPAGDFVFDIETASLVTFPCAYRLCEFAGDETLAVRSRRVSAIPSHPDFSAYARRTLETGVADYLEEYLRRYHFSPEEMRLLTPQLVRGLMAHTAGDEAPPAVLVDQTGFSIVLRLFLLAAGDLIDGAWHDLVPADNDLVIDAAAGDSRPIAE